MKNFFLLLIVLTVMTNMNAQNTSPEVYIIKTQTFLETLKGGKYDEAATYFDESVADKISTKVLKQAWESLPKQLGAIKSYGTPRVEESAPFHTVYIPVEFEKATLDLKMPYKDNQKAFGFMLVPHTTDPSLYKYPSYVDLAKVKEIEITVTTGKYKLPGMFVYPANTVKKFPVVILVHGSGPNDMDESLYANKPFKDLGYGLAAKNIGVIRYDKRTKTYGSQMIGKTNITLEEETIQDALSAIRLAKTISGVDTNRIFVIGHSLGAMAAPRIGAYAGKDIAGIVLMAGPARPLEDILLEQYTYLNASNPTKEGEKQIKDLKKQVDFLKSGEVTPKTPSNLLPLDQPAPYWIYMKEYHQVEVAQKLSMPILIMQGERDYQVRMTDFEMWQKALASNKKASFKSYPKLNHLFIEGEGKSIPKEYETAGHVATYVVDDIALWISQK